MKTRNAFTLVELLVVIGIIALLISILLPSLNKARQSAQNVKCLSNLRQLGGYAAIYAVDYKGAVLPWSSASRWGTLGSYNGLVQNFWHQTIAETYMRRNLAKKNAADGDAFTCPTMAANVVPNSGTLVGSKTYMINGFVSGYYDISKPPMTTLAGAGNGDSRSLPTGTSPTIAVNVDGTHAYPVKLSQLRRSSEIMLFVENYGASSFYPSNDWISVVFRGWQTGTNQRGDVIPAHFPKSVTVTSNAGTLCTGYINVAFVDGHAESQPYDKRVKGVPIAGVIADPTAGLLGYP